MLVSILTQALGLVCLSLSMDKHFKSAFARPSPPWLSIGLKWLGWVSIGLSILLVTFFTQTPTIAIVYWIAVLAINILLLGLVYCRLSLRKKIILTSGK